MEDYKYSDLIYFEGKTFKNLILQVPDFSNEGDPNINIPCIDHFFRHREIPGCEIFTKYVISAKTYYNPFTYKKLRDIKSSKFKRRIRMHFLDHMTYNLLMKYDRFK